ncbi:Protein P80, partial [Leucoagaricus sp. SymC.cos]
DMNMDSSNTTSSDGSMMVMMTPFFHFIGGDYLLFKAWKPSSGGVIAGTCIGLLFFAIFERWANAISPVLEDHLRQRALRKMPTSSIPGDMTTISRRTSSDTAETPPVAKKPNSRLPKRSIPPFIPSVDIPRGICYAFQRLLGFALMLAVMTYHSGYIISIIVGLGLGEILFGRIATRVVKPNY